MEKIAFPKIFLKESLAKLICVWMISPLKSKNYIVMSSPRMEEPILLFPSMVNFFVKSISRKISWNWFHGKIPWVHYPKEILPRCGSSSTILDIFKIKCSIEENGLHLHNAAVNTGQCSIIFPINLMKSSNSNLLSSWIDIMISIIFFILKIFFFKLYQ